MPGKFKAAVSVAAVLLVAASPAFADRMVLTPSGQPDAVFRGSVADSMGKLTNECMNRGWQVTSQTANQLVCEIPVGVMKAALQQMALGNSYSTAPRTFVRFTIAQVGDNSRAQASSWTETQMAFGQVRQHTYSDDNTLNNLQAFLFAGGGEPSPGSRFPGNYLGVEGEPKAEGKKVYIPVTTVVPGAPGALAGLQVGDRIVSINGKSFKSAEDFKAKSDKIAVGAQYPLGIERGSELLTLQLVARERPIAGSPEWMALEALAETKVNGEEGGAPIPETAQGSN